MKRRRKPARKRAARQLPVNGPADADPLADARIRPFVERYCDLAVQRLAQGALDFQGAA